MNKEQLSEISNEISCMIRRYKNFLNSETELLNSRLKNIRSEDYSFIKNLTNVEYDIGSIVKSEVTIKVFKTMVETLEYIKCFVEKNDMESAYNAMIKGLNELDYDNIESAIYQSHFFSNYFHTFRYHVKNAVSEFTHLKNVIKKIENQGNLKC